MLSSARHLAPPVLVLFIAGCLFGGSFGKKSKPRAGKGDTAATIMSSRGAGKLEALRIVLVRVHADQDYRRQTVRWRAHVKAMLARANKLLEPLLALSLRVESMQSWQRTSSPRDRDSMLRELAKLDAGDNMTWVIGFVGTLPRDDLAYDDIGAAFESGRHMFVRNVSDPRDLEQIRKSGADKEKLYAQRKRHKEVVALLHELGHTLGATHDNDDESIMYSQYERTQRSFGSAALDTMRRELQLESEGKPRGRNAENDALDPSGNSEKSEKARLAAERHAAAAAPARELLQRARASTDETTRRSVLQETELALVRLGAGYRALWNQLAIMYRGIGAITLTQRALDQAGELADQGVAEWAAQMRARFSLPPDAMKYGITSANETAYVEQMRRVLAAIAAGNNNKARAAVRKGRKQFGAAPGFQVMLCDIELRDRHYRRARASCNRALAAYDGASWAHFLVALMDERNGKIKAALRHLERALAIDKTLGPARAKLQQLRSRR